MAWVRPDNVRTRGEALVAVEFGKEWKDETGKVFQKIPILAVCALAHMSWRFALCPVSLLHMRQRRRRMHVAVPRELQLPCVRAVLHRAWRAAAAA